MRKNPYIVSNEIMNSTTSEIVEAIERTAQRIKKYSEDEDLNLLQLRVEAMERLIYGLRQRL